MSPIAPISAVAAPERVAAVPASSAGSAATHEQHGSAARRAQRHGLVDALTSALAVERGRDGRTDQAIARFAHALVHDLSRIGGDDRQAFGPREWGTLGPRIGALAGAALAQAAADREIPREPSPLTVVTAALHVMRVPSSRLVEAFRVLHETVPSVAEVVNGASDTRVQLATFLQRIAPTTPDAGASGALLDATA
jgi:hypothetical protein